MASVIPELKEVYDKSIKKIKDEFIKIGKAPEFPPFPFS